jgi:hypothetical protein
MTASDPVVAVAGFAAVSIACLLAGAFCLRSWRANGDRHYVLFAVGFWVVGLSWTALTLFIGFEWGRG